MIFYKKILFAIILAICCGYLPAMTHPSGKSVFTNNFSGVLFSNLKEAFEIYTGSWAGSQSVNINDKEVMKASVEQRYIPVATSGVPKLIGSGKINAGGDSIPTRCYMYLMEDYILLEIQTADMRTTKYSGIIDGNSVVWFSLSKFMAYDYQADSFFSSDTGIIMSSLGKRYIKVPAQKFEGFIEVKTVLEKKDSSYPTEKANLYKDGKLFSPSRKSFGN